MCLFYFACVCVAHFMLLLFNFVVVVVCFSCLVIVRRSFVYSFLRSFVLFACVLLAVLRALARL